MYNRATSSPSMDRVRLLFEEWAAGRSSRAGTMQTGKNAVEQVSGFQFSFFLLPACRLTSACLMPGMGMRIGFNVFSSFFATFFLLPFLSGREPSAVALNKQNVCPAWATETRLCNAPNISRCLIDVTKLKLLKLQAETHIVGEKIQTCHQHTTK